MPTLRVDAYRRNFSELRDLIQDFDLAELFEIRDQARLRRDNHNHETAARQQLGQILLKPLRGHAIQPQWECRDEPEAKSVELRGQNLTDPRLRISEGF